MSKTGGKQTDTRFKPGNNRGVTFKQDPGRINKHGRPKKVKNKAISETIADFKAEGVEPPQSLDQILDLFGMAFAGHESLLKKMATSDKYPMGVRNLITRFTGKEFTQYLQLYLDRKYGRAAQIVNATVTNQEQPLFPDTADDKQ